jgi:hypothetical protein
MSISYQSKDDRVQTQELKYRTLLLKAGDTQIVNTWAAGSGADNLIVDVRETVDFTAANAPVVLVMSVGATGGVVRAQSAAAAAVSGQPTQIKFNITSLAATDVAFLNYVVSE